MVSEVHWGRCCALTAPLLAGDLPPEMLGTLHPAFGFSRRCKGCALPQPPPGDFGVVHCPPLGARHRGWGILHLQRTLLLIPSALLSVCAQPSWSGGVTRSGAQCLQRAEEDLLGCPLSLPRGVPRTDQTRAWRQKVEGVKLLGVASPFPVCVRPSHLEFPPPPPVTQHPASEPGGKAGMGFGLVRQAGPILRERGCAEDRQRQLALSDSAGRGQVGGRRRGVCRGMVFIAQERGPKPNPGFRLG